MRFSAQVAAVKCEKPKDEQRLAQQCTGNEKAFLSWVELVPMSPRGLGTTKVGHITGHAAACPSSVELLSSRD